MSTRDSKPISAQLRLDVLERAPLTSTVSMAQMSGGNIPSPSLDLDSMVWQAVGDVDNLPRDPVMRLHLSLTGMASMILDAKTQTSSGLCAASTVNTSTRSPARVPVNSTQYRLTCDQMDNAATDVNFYEMTTSVETDMSATTLVEPVIGSALDSPVHSTCYRFTCEQIDSASTDVNRPAISSISLVKSVRCLVRHDSSSTLCSSGLIGTNSVGGGSSVHRRAAYDLTPAELSDKESFTESKGIRNETSPQEEADAAHQQFEQCGEQTGKYISADIGPLEQGYLFTPLPSPMIPLSERVVSKSEDGQDERVEVTPSLRARPGPLFHFEPVNCDHLQSCRDMRAEADGEYAVNGWSIQEGSLVIGVDPSYVVPPGGEQHFDELDLKEGKLYLVNRIFGDLWALCIACSTEKPHQGQIPGAPNEVVGIGFVPLCAVTLAANYSSFVQRCKALREKLEQVIPAPANGGRVVPPQRAQSLAEGREMAWRLSTGKTDLVSKKAYRICEKFRPIGEHEHDYQPKVKWQKQKLIFRNPRRAWKKRVAEKLEIVGSWVGPDVTPPESSTRPRKKLEKGSHHHINVGEGFRCLCSWVRGN